jgi:AraC family transcriptional regulator
MREEQLIKEYKSRINAAIDFIEKDLDHQFTLIELAEKANFSKFHFHRIFQGLMGETPFQFINRIRLEKAATLIVTNPNDPISEIAFRCAFLTFLSFHGTLRSAFLCLLHFGGSPIKDIAI